MASKKRSSTALWAVLLFALGLGYAAFGTVTGLWLPCPFYALTGLYCPGCGVSRMCLSLLRLDFAGAWRANPALLLCLPVLGGLLLSLAVRRKKTGDPRPSKAQNAVIWTVAVFLLAFGVARNLPWFAFLRPVG